MTQLKYQSAGASPLAWVVAVLSVILATLAVWVLHATLTGLHYARLQEQLRVTVTELGGKKRIFNDSRFFNVASGSNAPLHSAVEAADYIAKGNFRAALVRLDPQVYPASLEADVLAQRKLLGQINERTAKITTLTADWSAVDKQLDVLIARFAELQNRLRTTLKLPAADTSTLTEDALTFYQQGFLADLPTVQEVPTFVTDDKALLQLIHPETRHLSWQQKEELNALRAESKTFFTEWTEALRSAESAEQALDEEEGQLASLRRTASERSLALIGELSQANLPRAVSTVYATVRNILSRLGFSLPQLSEA
jgi:hypothetical protein